jgi:hypothetical protein
MKTTPEIFNRTEFEWRFGSHNHAVKLDSGRDGWEAMCGMKFTESFMDSRGGMPPSTACPFCKRCLTKTNTTLAIIPNQAVAKCFEVK